MDLTHLREEYKLDKLDEAQVHPNPMTQFEHWFNAWLTYTENNQLPDSNAMVVATVDDTGQPSQRIVLLKQFNENGFIFFTNYGSRKAKELGLNNKISLHFPWYLLERQVIVYGTASRLTLAENTQYFLSRPPESRIGAWASQQSSPISSRAALVQLFEQMKQKFQDGDIPLPDFWGGYQVSPSKMEFWQGGEHRLHDRILYTKSEAEDWVISRLSP